MQTKGLQHINPYSVLGTPAPVPPPYQPGPTSAPVPPPYQPGPTTAPVPPQMGADHFQGASVKSGKGLARNDGITSSVVAFGAGMGVAAAVANNGFKHGSVALVNSVAGAYFGGLTGIAMSKVTDNKALIAAASGVVAGAISLGVEYGIQRTGILPSDSRSKLSATLAAASAGAVAGVAMAEVIELQAQKTGKAK